MNFLERKIVAILAILLFGLAACATQKPAMEGSAAPSPEPARSEPAKPSEHAPPAYPAGVNTAPSAPEKSQTAAPPRENRLFKSNHLHYMMKRLDNRAMLLSASEAESPALDDNDPRVQAQSIDNYLKNLQSAAYTFNPPSPIKVDEPKTIHLWLDPQATTAQLAEELRKSIPQQDAGRIESGQTKWSPNMKASLSAAPGDFSIHAIDPEEQAVSSTQRTTWSWDITPKHPGKNLQLHLRLEAVLPAPLAHYKTITTLDRQITVEVTWWWLFDHYYEKYWKELLIGLGGILTSIFGWWWKNKRAAAKKLIETI